MPVLKLASSILAIVRAISGGRNPPLTIIALNCSGVGALRSCSGVCGVSDKNDSRHA